MNKKILFICTDSNTVINFRKELIEYLKARGFEVDVLAGDSKREKEIKELNVKFYSVPFSNRSKNPFELRKIEQGFRNVIKKSKPDIVFTFQLKPNIFGVKAARKEKIKHIYSMIEGLGDPFQPVNLKGQVLRYLISKMYKSSLKHVDKVFLLNKEDKDECVARKIIKEKQAYIVHSIGIDMNKYSPTPLPKEKKVIYLARMLKNKGIIDFCEVARKVHKSRPDIIFELCGAETNEIKKEDLLPYINDGSIIYDGFLKDVNSVINSSRIYASLSYYREGFPRTLLECMALKRTVIATNVIGNKDGVIDSKTGYLLPAHDIDGFAKKIIEIIDDDELLTKLGENAYNFCKENFDSDIINSEIYKVISE